jgi:hypothetical protein
MTLKVLKYIFKVQEEMENPTVINTVQLVIQSAVETAARASKVRLRGLIYLLNRTVLPRLLVLVPMIEKSPALRHRWRMSRNEKPLAVGRISMGMVN